MKITTLILLCLYSSEIFLFIYVCSSYEAIAIKMEDTRGAVRFGMPCKLEYMHNDKCKATCTITVNIESLAGLKFGKFGQTMSV